MLAISSLSSPSVMGYIALVLSINFVAEKIWSCMPNFVGSGVRKILSYRVFSPITMTYSVSRKGYDQIRNSTPGRVMAIFIKVGLEIALFHLYVANLKLTIATLWTFTEILSLSLCGIVTIPSVGYTAGVFIKHLFPTANHQVQSPEEALLKGRKNLLAHIQKQTGLHIRQIRVLWKKDPILKKYGCDTTSAGGSGELAEIPIVYPVVVHKSGGRDHYNSLSEAKRLPNGCGHCAYQGRVNLRLKREACKEIQEAVLELCKKSKEQLLAILCS